MVKEWRSEVRRRWFVHKIPLAEVGRGSALVVAPHPDDETLGCGGLIWQKRAWNSQVQVMVISNGEASFSAHAEVDPQTVARVRRRQAIQALHILGVAESQISWLGIRDDRIPNKWHADFAGAVSTVKMELMRIRPEEIYCPHLFDAEPDHQATAQIVAEAIRQCDFTPRLFFYPIWAWFNSAWKISAKLDFAKAWKIRMGHAGRAKKTALSQYFADTLQPFGIPYGGKLPKTIIRAAKSQHEVFFNS